MKISIVVPIYNVEEHLEQCIESLINQTYNNLEIILIDDSSTDHFSIANALYRRREIVKNMQKKILELFF